MSGLISQRKEGHKVGGSPFLKVRARDIRFDRQRSMVKKVFVCSIGIANLVYAGTGLLSMDERNIVSILKPWNRFGYRTHRFW